MAPVVQTNSTVGGATSTSAALTLPTGIQTNDILLVTIYKENQEPVAKPDGTWFEKGPTPVTSEPAALFTLWKRCVGGESGTATFSWQTSAFRRVTCWRISGCIASGEPFGQFTTAQTNSSVTTLNIALSGTSPDSLLAWAGGVSSAGNSWTPPSGFTEVNDLLTVANASKDNSAGGDTGTLTGTAVSAGKMMATLATLLPIVANPQFRMSPTSPFFV